MSALAAERDRRDERDGRSGTGLPRGLLHPRHPERICWGCDRYCPAGDLRCGSGFIRTPHPCELFGEDWLEDDPGTGGPGAGA